MISPLDDSFQRLLKDMGNRISALEKSQQSIIGPNGKLNSSSFGTGSVSLSASTTGGTFVSAGSVAFTTTAASKAILVVDLSISTSVAGIEEIQIKNNSTILKTFSTTNQTASRIYYTHIFNSVSGSNSLSVSIRVASGAGTVSILGGSLLEYISIGG